MTNIRPTAYQLVLLKTIIRPEFYNLEGRLQCNLFGVSTGSAITPFINNFYVYKIDHFFAKDSELFYARYGDDILLCHPDRVYLKNKSDELKALINSMILRVNIEKEFLGYFTPAGNSCEDVNFKGLNAYDYLGYRLNANGTFSLSKKRQKKFLNLIYHYIYTINKTSKFENEFYRGKIICDAINNSYKKTIMGEQAAFCLIHESCDHSQLRHLDYLIALRIAESLSHIRGVKAFRYVSYKTIRSTFGLKSLIQLRNKV